MGTEKHTLGIIILFCFGTFFVKSLLLGSNCSASWFALITLAPISSFLDSFSAVETR